MAIIIEVLNKQHKVTERHRFTQPRIALGRAYNNDLILYDKHVSPHHAELVLSEEGRWQLVDLASLNGSFAEPAGRLQQATELQSGQLCWLGEQAVRIFDEHHPVPPALPYNSIEQRLRHFGHPVLIVLLALFLIAEELFSLWLAVPEQGQSRWSRNLLNLPLLMLGLALWPALLALWAKINQHEARFLPQLGITFAVVVLMECWQALMTVLNFSLDGAAAVVWLGDIGQTALVILLLAANFYLALQMSALKKVALATGVGVLLSLQGVAVSLLFADHGQLAPKFDSSLMPLTFYLNKPIASEDFAKDSAELFRLTDEARQEPAEQ